MTIGLTDAGTDPLTSSNHLHLDAGENLTLAPGTYYFEHIRLTAPTSLTLTGPTTIYLVGNLDATSGAVINTTQNPADLTIISSGNHIKMTGSVQFYGSILAPNAEIQLAGNADYFGALVGGSVDFGGNFSFHMDESLPLGNMLKGPVVLVR